MRLRQALFSCLLLTAVVGRPATVLAQPAADQDPRVSQARALFDEGTAHYGEGRYVLAAQSFQRAYELMAEAGRPTAPLILYNVGASLVEIAGREQEARDAYSRFLEQVDGVEQNEQVREQIARAQDQIRELDARVGPTQGGGGTGISPVGPIVLGVGVASMVAGAITGGLALDAEATAEAGCVDGHCPPENEGPAQDAETLAIVTDALLFGGLAVAAAGTVLLFVLTEEREASVALGCDGGLCGVLTRGRF